ncbi:MAG: hypothetical protein AB1451_07205 [Nitrospirota bacterium]
MLRRIEDIEPELAHMTTNAIDMVCSVIDSRPEHTLLARQAEWHICGIHYHCERFYEQYRRFVEEAAARVATGAEAVVMYSPDSQRMFFEFYALVVLARIVLDNLRHYVAPAFTTRFGEIPKSVTAVLKGETNCPLYEEIRGNALLAYLIDLRDCLVHYHSFAVSDNVLLIQEGATTPGAMDRHSFFAGMARAFFRRVNNCGASVNVYLPDKIFETHSGHRRLADFTYDKKWHILSMAVGFANLSVSAVAKALKVLQETDTPIFRYAKRCST